MFRHLLGGTGGSGDPFQRDSDHVAFDVAEGKISIAHARREYGVAIDAETGAVIADETRRLRRR